MRDNSLYFKIIRSPWLYCAILGGMVGFGAFNFTGSFGLNVIIASLISILVGVFHARIARLEELYKEYEKDLQKRLDD